MTTTKLNAMTAGIEAQYRNLASFCRETHFAL
jgi:hypothetical protein